MLSDKELRTSSAARIIAPCLMGSVITAFAILFTAAVPHTRSAEPTPGTLDSDPALTLQIGHVGAIQTLTFSPSGALLLSSEQSGIAKLWHVTSGKLLRDLKGHEQSIREAHFAPSGRRIITVDEKGLIRLWDAENSTVLKEHRLQSAAVSRDAKYVAGTADDGIMRLFDAETGAALQQFEESTSGTFSPDCSKLLTVRKDQRLFLWDIGSGKKLSELKHPPKAATGFRFSMDGTRIAAASYDVALVWEVKTGDLINTFTGHKFEVTDVALSPDAKLVATAGVDHTARIWDIASGKERHVLNGHLHRLTSLAFDASGTRLVTSSWDYTARLWSVDSGKEMNLYNTHAIVTRATFSPSGNEIATGSSTGLVLIWPAQSDNSIDPAIKAKDAISTLSDENLCGLGIVFDEVASGAQVLGVIPTSAAAVDGRLRPGDIITAVAADGAEFVGVAGAAIKRLLDAKAGATLRLRVLKGANGQVEEYAVEGRTFTTPRLILSGSIDPIVGVWFSPRGDRIVISHNDRQHSITVVNIATGVVKRTATPHNVAVGEVVFSTNGEFIVTFAAQPILVEKNIFNLPNQDATARLWNLASLEAVEFRNATAELLEELRRSQAQRLVGNKSPDGGSVIDSNASGVWLRDSNTRRVIRTLESLPLGNHFSPDGRQLLTLTHSARAVGIVDTRTGRLLFQIALANDGKWMIVDPEGRFDVSDIERVRGMHWVAADDPFTPLTIESFVRDRYEPRLLGKGAFGTLTSVAPVVTLNRVQPVVDPPVVNASEFVDIVKALVSVRGNSRLLPRSAEEMRTDVYDLRLFRNGQMIGRWPEPRNDGEAEFDSDPTRPAEMQKWRELNRVKADGQRVIADADGKMTVSFPVRLPSRPEPGPVEFTAYAFNEDRVKSETARFTYQAPAQPATRKPRAYLACVGVSACQTAAWDLAFAAKDAQAIAGSLDSALKDRYDVVPVVLTSQYTEEGTVASTGATKENLHAVLDLLAGKQVDAAIRERLPQGSKLQAATPDDLVLVSFSGHGYTDTRGALQLIPYDVGSGQKSVTDAQSRCISSGELSAWLRGIDAGETVLVVDACHSAAAIAEPGFKPGPLGNRGLGQLAYDKGMRVLAAAQGDDVALESRKVKQGLLTYALVRDGLEQRRAAKDGKITLGGLLTYAAERVPSLYEEVVAGKVKDAAGETAKDVDGVQPKDPAKSRVQRPELFDYAKKRAEIPLFTTN